MPQYPKDIIDVIAETKTAAKTIARTATHVRATPPTETVSYSVAGLTLTPSLDREPVTGRDIGVVEIDFTEPVADSLVDTVRDYKVTWSAVGIAENVQYQFGPPPLTYYGLPIGKALTICVTPRTRGGALGATVCSPVTIPGDTVGPNQPSTPTVTAVLNGVEVAWDGKDTSSPTPQNMPSDFQQLIIYSGTTAGFDPLVAGTKVGEINSISGGEEFVWAYNVVDTIYIRTVAIDHWGNRSPASTAGSAIPLTSTVDLEPGSIGYEEIAFKQADNLIPDGSFEDLAARTAIGGTWLSDGLAFHGLWHMHVTSNGTQIVRSLLAGNGVGPGNKCMQIGPYEKFLARTGYKSAVGTNGTATFHLICYNGSGTVISPEPIWYTLNEDGTTQDPASMVPAVDTSWGTGSGFIVPPTGTVFVEPQLVVEATSTTGSWNFDGVEFRRVIQTAIIDDAAITNAQIKSLKVDKLDGGDVTADFVVARGSVRTVEIDPDTGLQVGPVLDKYGFHQFDTTGQPLIDFPTTPSESNPNVFNGTVRAKRFESASDGTFVLFGSGNSVAVNSRLLLADTIPDPTTTLLPTISWEYVQQPAPNSYELHYGLTKGHDGRWYIVEEDSYALGHMSIQAYNADGTFSQQWFIDADDVAGIVYAAHHTGRYYVLYLNDTDGEWYVQAYDTSMALVGTPQITWLEGSKRPTIGWDFTDDRLLLCQASISGNASIDAYTVASTGVITFDDGSTLQGSYDHGMGFVSRGTFDFGADRYIVRAQTYTAVVTDFRVMTPTSSRGILLTRTISSTTITTSSGSFDVSRDVGAKVTGTGIPAGTTIVSVASSTTATMSAAATSSGSSVTSIDPSEVASLNWPAAYSSSIAGAWWDGTNFWSLAGTTGRRVKYEGNGNKWTTESGVWWASYSLYDSDVSGGQHESKNSPRVQINPMAKRGRLTLTGPPPPDSGNPDDPNRIRFYLSRGAADDTIGTSTWRQGEFIPSPPGSTAPSSIVITNAVFTGTPVTDNPPTTSSFTTGLDPGFVASGALRADQTPMTYIDGLGAANVDGVLGPGDAKWSFKAADHGLKTDGVTYNWLLCDGRAVSRTLYIDLFSEIGTMCGAGDGTTTFNLPDVRRRFMIGAWPDGASPLPIGWDNAANETEQSRIDRQVHSHDHGATGLTTGSTGSSHTHGIPGQGNAGVLTNAANGSGNFPTARGDFNGHAHGGNTTTTGSGHDHNVGGSTADASVGNHPMTAASMFIKT